MSQSGDVWASEGGDFYRYAEGAWHATGLVFAERYADVGPDGTVWGFEVGPTTLYRWDGTDWTQWSVPEGAFNAFLMPLSVAPDGSVWFGQDYLDCGGVGHFDGKTWDHYPLGCVHALDVADDGSIWVLVGESAISGNASDLYVITPEAVAAST